MVRQRIDPLMEDDGGTRVCEELFLTKILTVSTNNLSKTKNKTKALRESKLKTTICLLSELCRE